MLYLWKVSARRLAAAMCAGEVPGEEPQKTQTTRGEVALEVVLAGRGTVDF